MEVVVISKFLKKTQQLQNHFERKYKQKNCNHEEWYMDTHVRVIKCCSCGKKAWVKEYINLYPQKRSL